MFLLARCFCCTHTFRYGLTLRFYFKFSLSIFLFCKLYSEKKEAAEERSQKQNRARYWSVSPVSQWRPVVAEPHSHEYVPSPSTHVPKFLHALLGQSFVSEEIETYTRISARYAKLSTGYHTIKQWHWAKCSDTYTFESRFEH